MCAVAVVERILAKHRLSLDNHKLIVSRMKPAPPPYILRRPIDPCLLLVKHISPNCSTAELNSFLLEHGKCGVQTIHYGLQPGIALAQFRDTPGQFPYGTSHFLNGVEVLVGVSQSYSSVVLVPPKVS